MGSTANAIIETYGWVGVLIVLLAAIAYLIWKEHSTSKRNDANKADSRKMFKDELGIISERIDSKMEAISSKVDLIQTTSNERRKLLEDGMKVLNDKIDRTDERVEKLEGELGVVDKKIVNGELFERIGKRVEDLESKMHKCYAESKIKELQEAKAQTSRVLMKSKGGLLSKSLRSWCNAMNADHLYIAQFHNGTTDLRGIHFVKFDVITDEFADPLHLAEGDREFTPLYRNQYIVAYGDIAYTMCHVPAAVFDVDSEEFLEQSDTLYRRLKTIGAYQKGFAMIRDNDGEPIGWLGAVSFGDKKIDCNALEKAAREIENIYNATDYD